MSLDECMDKHSHRQYLTWLEWLREHYARQAQSPSAGDKSTTSYSKPTRLSTVDDDPTVDGPPTLTKEQVAKYRVEMAKANTMRRFGMLTPLLPSQKK